jgi:LPS export ABC transporter protein LptC
MKYEVTPLLKRWGMNFGKICFFSPTRAYSCSDKFTLYSSPFTLQTSSVKRFLALIFCLFTVALLSACKDGSRAEKKIKRDTAATEIEGSLIFKNVTLDQADEKGHPLWKVKAKQAIYTKDKKLGNVESPTGDLFQDGKVVLRVSADNGEIRENGQQIFLKGHIVATDTRNGAVFRGDELEWHPKEDL